MTSYARAATDAPERVVQEAFHDLKREGEGLPQPSQGEVVEFLEHQEFTVRHDQVLAPVRRESILTRLRTALSAARRGILPDGGTFHAWRNVVSESWSRVRRKAAAVVAMGAIAFSVGACGSAPAQSQSTAPHPQVSASAPAVAPSATPKAAAGEDPPAALPAQQTFSGPVVDTFGQERVQAAARQMVDYVQRVGWKTDRIWNSNVQVSDFRDVAEQMTPRAAGDFLVAVSKANTDKQANATVEATAYWGFSGEYTPTGRYYDRAVSPITVSVDRSDGGTARLRMSFSANETIGVKNAAGQVFALKTTRTADMWLTPNPHPDQTPQFPWLVDGLQGTYLVDQPTPAAAQ